MKHFLLFFLTYIILLNADAQKNKINDVYVYKYVDVFNQHIKILDSAMKYGSHYNNSTCDSSIRYMERVTHIPTHFFDASCWGDSPPCSWQDLGLWKTWYKNIGSKRIGVIN